MKLAQWIITKEYHFSAAHQLIHLGPEHQCARLHGHNYLVTVAIKGLEELSEDGMVVDYAVIDQLMKPLIGKLDHYNLNEVILTAFPFLKPGVYAPSSFYSTAENLAWMISVALRDALDDLLQFEQVDLEYVEVKETQKTSARYYPPSRMD